MIHAAHVAGLLAVVSTGVVYGTDVFCALVLRSALARVNDATLTAIMGNVHRFGDRRMWVPGVLGIVGASVASILAAVAGDVGAAASAGTALAMLLVWLLPYVRISAPINRALTAAADEHRAPDNARALQHDWDRVIVRRAILQGLAVVALCLSLAS